jgi:formate C-acetyltransferase
MWAEWYPETAVNWVMKDIESNEEAYKARAEELEEQKEICNYWKNRTIEYAVLSHLNDSERERLHDTSDKGAYLHFISGKLDRMSSYQVVDYESVIKKGLLGIIADVTRELETTPIVDDDSLNKVNFLRALIIFYKAGIQYGKRYAVLARELARKAEGARKIEFKRIAAVCDRVPANPARSFHEAVQALWFIHVLIFLDMKTIGLSPGRADQYLWPYYEHDIRKGKLTREEAVEILECLRPKMSSFRSFTTSSFLQFASGEAGYYNITLGGLTPDGKDATNELSYLFLDAASRTRSPHHTLSVRVHDDSPEDFLLKSAQLCAGGCGYPAFFADKPHMEFLMNTTGASLEEARDYAIGGCVVPQVPKKSSATTALAFNMAKCLELALHDGFDPYTAKQIGPKTGRFENFNDYEEIVEAYTAQLRQFSHEGAWYTNLHRAYIDAKLSPFFYSGLIDGCIQRGKSGQGAGPRYRISYHNATGMIDVVDSLAAVKRCVFEDGSISKQDLLKALDNNFEGMGGVRRLLLASPKYGNDDDYADNIAHDLYDQWQRMVSEELDALYGDKYLPCAYSVSSHIPMGERVGALPSGRLAGESLADGSVSPSHGADVKGPTAALNSAAKIDQSPIEATLLNIKFQPSLLQTDNDLRKFLALIKTYFQNGGKHIQFNVVDRETLIDAQVHRERHRNLLVRVAGYSALFVELSSGAQDEIIARTAHGLYP